MTTIYFRASAFLFLFTVFSINVFGQLNGLLNFRFDNREKVQILNPNSFVSRPQSSEDVKPSATTGNAAFPNPILLNFNENCSAANLKSEKFGEQIGADQRVAFCEAIQDVSSKLKENWSPALSEEIRQIWQIFIRENVKIRPMKKDVSSEIVAMAGAFEDDKTQKEFSANFYLRPERADDKSFFLVFMHELRHVFDAYLLWKNKTNVTQAEMEKRAFRIMGKIYQETARKEKIRGLPAFWKNEWKKLSAAEIEQKREEKIIKFMRRSGLYKNLLKNPESYMVGYSPNQRALQQASLKPINETGGEKLPVRPVILQPVKEIPQNIKEISFKMETVVNRKNPDELLRAALINEKNLYRKMDNFVYEQNLNLQCWKKQKVIETFGLTRSIARVQNGGALFENESVSSSSAKSPNAPSCVVNFDSIKTDATETFWAAPYLDRMDIKFDYFQEIDGVKVAVYTVYAPDSAKFNQMAAQYPNIKPFRAFVGQIFVSVEDPQIVRFAGTSFPEAEVTGYQCANRCASYGATAVRQKLASGIWVTTLLNIVAVTTDKKGKLKPFSYEVKYQNYRQAASEVKILDDEEIAVTTTDKINGKMAQVR